MEQSEKEARKARKEAALDQMFGKERGQFLGHNPWGRTMTLLGLAVLLFTIVFAVVGTMNGTIKWDDRDKTDKAILSPEDVVLKSRDALKTRPAADSSPAKQ